MSSEGQPPHTDLPVPSGAFVAPAVAQGCLVGLGMTLGFGLLGVMTYFALSLLGLPTNIALVIAIPIGPIVGTLAIVVVMLRRSKQQADLYLQRIQEKHEAATRDESETLSS
ncbi:MAG: hypothetical protein GYB68_02000 [Chloroflexi bacterium]|nr:hypothetical protein [Chloroflexota bacterium]